MKVLSEIHRFKRLALALCPTFLNPATPPTEVSTTPLGRRRDLFLGDNLDLWLEATRAAIGSYGFDDLLFRQIPDIARSILQGPNELLLPALFFFDLLVYRDRCSPAAIDALAPL